MPSVRRRGGLPRDKLDAAAAVDEHWQYVATSILLDQTSRPSAILAGDLPRGPPSGTLTKPGCGRWMSWKLKQNYFNLGSVICESPKMSYKKGAVSVLMVERTEKLCYKRH